MYWRIWQSVSVSLRDVEDMHRTEAHHALRRTVLVRCLRCVLALVDLVDDRSEDRDSLLTLLDLASHRLPGFVARDECCVRSLESDQHRVTEAVCVEACASVQPC